MELRTKISHTTCHGHCLLPIFNFSVGINFIFIIHISEKTLCKCKIYLNIVQSSYTCDENKLSKLKIAPKKNNSITRSVGILVINKSTQVALYCVNSIALLYGAIF